MARDGDEENDEAAEAKDAAPPMVPLMSARREWQRKSTVSRCSLATVVAVDGDNETIALKAYRQDKALDAETKEFLLEALKQNRFCKSLEEKSLRSIIDGMECFKFEAGQTVMVQNHAGSYFFVTQDGALEASVNGKVTERLSKGSSFGEIALLYKTGRAATVVAKETAIVWGADGETFRRVVREHSEQHYAENRAFLDRMSIFDGLPATKKDKVGHLALFTEACNAGQMVIPEGAVPAAVYFAKSGQLKFQGPSGETIEKLNPGDCLGWRALLYGETQLYSAVAESPCELIGVGLPQLKELLGEDIGSVLMQTFLLAVLRRHHAISRLHTLQRQKIAKAMNIESFPVGTKIQNDSRLAIVVDGAMSGTRNGETVKLRRGEWTEDSAFAKLTAEACASSGQDCPDLSHLGEATSTHRRCKVAMLSKDGLVAALREAGSELDTDEEKVLEYLQKVLMIQKVSIFGDLSCEQIDALVTALVLKTYDKGTKVVTEGEVGEAFYIIASGEVNVTIAGKHIRDLGKSACFGERALIFGEPRSATVMVTSQEAALWSIDREAFKKCVTPSMRENLAQRMNIKDTSVSLKALKHKRLIGAGSFGSVRMVEHKKTGLRYALKRIRKNKNGTVPDEVQQECNLLSEIEHPFILTLVTTFQTAKSIYLLTELLTGGQLHEQVTEKMGVLSRKHSQFYIGALTLILEALHDRHIVFRDLKPDNVMLDNQGYVKLVDFGLAKKLDLENPRTFTACGTMLYMAPEVINGEGYAFECDIWSLGIVFFELVCGCYPFGDGADCVDDILCEVMTKQLEIPARYGDNSGKKLLQGLLTKESEKRLGTGPNGWEDIKAAKFFKQGVQGNLFSQITGRELAAPLCPEGEKYSNEKALAEEVTLSDADELGADEPVDFACRLLTTFSKFDLDGDGRIDRAELGLILTKIDPKTFTDDVIDQLMVSIDVNGDNHINYDEFVAWIVNTDAAELRDALRCAVKLDVHA